MLLILIQRKLIPHDFNEIKICIKNNNLLVYIPRVRKKRRIPIKEPAACES